MKKIWIDGFEANVKQRVGSGQVAFEILRNIEKLDHKNDYTILLTAPPLEDLPKEREGFKYKLIKPNRIITLVAIPWALHKAKQKPDVFLSLAHYIPRFFSVKSVAIINDLAYLHFPNMFTKKDLYKLTSWTAYTVKNSAKLIAISKATKKDLIENYDIDSGKVIVSYPGYDRNLFKPMTDKIKINEVLEKYNINPDIPYVIFIGTLQPRKNVLRLIESIVKIENFQLVIVGKTTGFGKQGWMYQEILDAPEKLGIKDKVIFTGFAPSEELPYLISGSKAYILPSLWEGFGIPVAESLACGVPAIVSNVSSLPEVVGEAGLLIDPKSNDQIEHAIRLMVTDKKLHAKLAKKTIDQAKKFSWEKMAKEVIKVLENI